MEELCETYWPPLYAYVRRKGVGPDEAMDRTQGFFAHIIEKRMLDHVDPARGKFRTFLLVSLNNFLKNEWAKESAQKRPPKWGRVSMDVLETRYADLSAESRVLTPDELYDRRWAVTVLDQAVQTLRLSYERAGNGELFGELSRYLVGNDDGLPYRDVAERLNMTEGAVKVAVYRIRAKYRDSIRGVIAETVATAEEVDEEVRDLLASLS